MVEPAEFLDIAEEGKAIQQIERAVFERALDLFATWDRDGLPLPRLAVNVSGRRLLEPELLDSVKALRGSAVRIDIELVETTFLGRRFGRDDLGDWTRSARTARRSMSMISERVTPRSPG